MTRNELQERFDVADSEYQRQAGTLSLIRSGSPDCDSSEYSYHVDAFYGARNVRNDAEIALRVFDALTRIRGVCEADILAGRCRRL